MISKNDCLLLLSDLGNKSPKVKEYSLKLFDNSITLSDVISFINQNRQIDLSKFYEKLRKSYNDKHSKLYKNIVKETIEPQDVVTTLSALLTQITLYLKNCEDKQMFLRHSRAQEILRVLNNYVVNNDYNPCIDLIKLIKLDLKVLEKSLINQ